MLRRMLVFDTLILQSLTCKVAHTPTFIQVSKEAGILLRGNGYKVSNVSEIEALFLLRTSVVCRNGEDSLRRIDDNDVRCNEMV